MLARNDFMRERNIPERPHRTSMGVVALALCVQSALTVANHAETIAETLEHTIEFGRDNLREAWRGFLEIELE